MKITLSLLGCLFLQGHVLASDLQREDQESCCLFWQWRVLASNLQQGDTESLRSTSTVPNPNDGIVGLLPVDDAPVKKDSLEETDDYAMCAEMGRPNMIDSWEDGSKPVTAVIGYVRDGKTYYF